MGAVRLGQARVMIYCFYLFDRDGVCLYYEDWNRSTKPKSLPGAADGGGGPRSAAPRTALAPPPPGRGCPGTRPRAAVAAVPLGMLRRMLTRAPPPPQKRRPRAEEQKLIFGLLFSLKATVCAMRPGGDGKMTVDGLQVCACTPGAGGAP